MCSEGKRSYWYCICTWLWWMELDKTRQWHYMTTKHAFISYCKAGEERTEMKSVHLCDLKQIWENMKPKVWNDCADHIFTGNGHVFTVWTQQHFSIIPLPVSHAVFDSYALVFPLCEHSVREWLHISTWLPVQIISISTTGRWLSVTKQIPVWACRTNTCGKQ